MTDRTVGTGWATDIGPREKMQDNVLTGGQTPFVVVADGVSSAPDSESTALVAVDTFATAVRRSTDTDRVLDTVLSMPGRIVDRLCKEGILTGASTMSGAVLDDLDRLWVMNIGDSSVAVLDPAGVQFCTRPHNVSENARVLGSDNESDLKADHILTRSINATALDARPDVSVFQIDGPSVVVALTDGVSKLVTYQEIWHLVFGKNSPVDWWNSESSGPESSEHEVNNDLAKKWALRILDRARAVGLQDNATAAVLVVVPGKKE